MKNANTPTKIIIDCDPGNGIIGSDIDDGIALALTLCSPEKFDLRAITIVAGNTPLHIGYSVAKDFTRRFCPSVPVYAGAAQPIREEPGPWQQRFMSRQNDPALIAAWSQVETPEQREIDPQEPDAVSILIETVAKHPGEVTVAALGPLTNIAAAIQRRPEFVQEVGCIAIMGGHFAVPNVLQEFNFANDPEAAQLVLSSGAPVLLVPLDATIQTLLTDEELDKWSEISTALTDYLVSTSRPWLPISSAQYNISGCLLHDPLVIALLLDRSVGKTASMMVDVSLHGLTRSRVVGWAPEHHGLHVGVALPTHQPIEVVVAVDANKLLQVMFNAFSHWSSISGLAIPSERPSTL